MTNKKLIEKLQEDMEMRGFSHYTKDSYLRKTKEIQNILWTGNNYWLASRCVITDSFGAYFEVRGVSSYGVYEYGSLTGFSSYLNEGSTISVCAIHPLVTLKSEVIDIDAGYDETTGWKLK